MRRAFEPAYIEDAGVIASKGDDRLATRGQLDLVLRPEPGDDLDAVGSRHDGLQSRLVGGSWVRVVKVET